MSMMLVLAVLLLVPVQPGGATLVQEGPPLDLGLQEEAGVTLLILDVKVRDKKGRPVRGLTRKDFEVTINGRLWSLAAVDDLCNCEASPEVDPQEQVRGESTTDQSTTSLPQHFVIYLDFSELQHTGRLEAERQARHWIEKGMQPGDQVMLVGFSTATDLVEITPFTTDRVTLLEGLEAVFADEAFVDPFPLFLEDRLADCPRCFDTCMSGDDPPLPESCFQGCCYGYARDEANQGRRALEALELFVSSLEDLPGRKQSIYFNQNNMIYPHHLYLPRRDMQAWSINDHRRLLESVGATATASRTAINVATMPFAEGLTNNLGDRVVALGSNLADFSGGTASRTLYDLPSTLDRAGRECCMYRLSVQVPEDPPRRTLQAKVAVRGRALDLSYRVRFYTPQERWFRHARLALMKTSRSSDSQVQLALLPLARREERWSVEAQVALALQDLELVPGIRGGTSRWRVGALLHREDGDKTWEMLTLAQATLKGTGSTGLQALHTRKIDNLKPGDYRLRAFVEDAEMGKFWSREVTLSLPTAGENPGEEPWLSDPVPARRINGRLDLDLAPVTKKLPVSSVVGAPAPGFVPMNEAHVVAGTILEFRTMLCPAPAEGAEPSTVSILLQDDRPLARLPAAGVENAGECAVLTDTVDTSAIAPGEYSYRLMLKRGEQEEPLLREAAVTIRPAPGL